MKKLRYILPILACVVVFIYWKEKNNFYVDFIPCFSSYTSRSRAASIEDGSYVYTYFPLKTDFALRNHDLTIKFDTAWVQHSWYEKSVGYFFVKKDLKKSLTTIFPFKKSADNTFLFSLKSYNGNNFEKYAGGIEENRYENSYERIGDTIMLLIIEKDPIDSIGWQNYTNGDTVIFVRAKNISK